MLLFTDHGITLGHFPPAPATRGQLQDPASSPEAGAPFFDNLLKALGCAILIATAGFVSAANAQNVSCTCRYQGEDYGIGESICLKSSGGMKMATCSMVLNNTSWKFSNAPCPLSQLTPDAVKQVENSKPQPSTGPGHHVTTPVSPG